MIDTLKSTGISTFGAATIWTTFAIMLLASITFTVQMAKVPKEYRMIPLITMMVTIISTLSYFAMAVSEGVVTDIKTHRLVLYARYIDWAIASPLLLLELSLIASLGFISILYIIAFDELMIVSELFASFDHSDVRWIWYTVSVAFWIPIVKELFVDGRQSAHLKSDSLGKLYDVLTSWTLFLWTLYPLVWGLSMGGNVISLDAEIASYALLDIGTKVVFGASLVFNKEFTHLDQSYGRIRLHEDPEEREPRSEAREPRH